MIKSWAGNTRLSFNWTTNALETVTCFSPFVSDLLGVFAATKWPRSFLLWINIKKGKGRNVKISLSKSLSHSIFQRAQLDHNFSHSPVTSCKIIPPHMQVIKQSSSFYSESARWLWWQDKSHPTTHTIPAYLEKSDSSATNGEGCAVKATCPRLWGIHIMENSDSPPLGWFSTQVREAKGLLPLNCGYWVSTQPNCTTALIRRSYLPLPKPQEALAGHGCTVRLPRDQQADDASHPHQRKP